ncbi:MAG TPA: glycerol kinase GlpK [Thermoleophilia bacterium]|nr:glycerol kinase GlpK [Thermoleophilia bacterium]
MAGPASPMIIALDQGTTSSRALLVRPDGTIAAVSQRGIGQTYPKPGWVEQDPQEIWAAQRETARAVLEQAAQESGEAGSSTVGGLGITNQRETTIVWERATGTPVHNAIVWQDRRTAPVCEELRAAGAEELVRQKTGLLLDPYFSATKIRWIIERFASMERARAGELAFGTVDSWLVWNLTGGRLHVTDATNASRTLLYDIRTGEWDQELLDLFGVPREVLPTVVDTSGVVGETDPAVFGAPLPVAALCGDQQAALFGQACHRAGSTKVTYGTGCFLLANVGDEPLASQHGLLTTVALQRAGRRRYALEGSAFVGGAAVKWLKGLGLIESSAASGELAASLKAGEGGVFVPALAGLGAPHWDPAARGAFFGLSLATTPAHLARATLDGIAFQVADLVKAAQADCAAVGTLTLAELRADGGAAANDVLMQTQADLLGLPVARAAQTESTALGAAYLAGLAVGTWADEDEVARLWRAERRFEPDPEVDRDRLGAIWRRAIAAVRAVGAE